MASIAVYVVYTHYTGSIRLHVYHSATMKRGPIGFFSMVRNDFPRNEGHKEGKTVFHEYFTLIINDI